jgi:glycosyltransferase involved in cell wall biosynthesis
VDTDLPPVLSVIIPVYNEQDVFPLMVQRLRPILDGMCVSYEVVAVDDGSSDGTAAVLHRVRRTWRELRVVQLYRNCGQQAALTAGLRRANGTYLVSIDADLQDPPEKIPEMLELARRDAIDVVYGVRSDRSSDTWAKRYTAGLYYLLMRRLVGVRIPRDAGDFRLLSRSAVEILLALPEQQPVYRLLIPWLGFRSTEVTYERARRIAGRTKYPLTKMLRLAANSITAFSSSPLRIATWLGIACFVACGCLLVFALVGSTVPTWTPWLLTTVLLSGVQLLGLGVLGEYIGNVHRILQGRPTYLVHYDSDEARPFGEASPMTTAAYGAAGPSAVKTQR